MKNSILIHFLINAGFVTIPIITSHLGLAQVAVLIGSLVGIAIIGGSLLIFSRPLTREGFVFWPLSYILGGLIMGIISPFFSLPILNLIFVILVCLGSLIMFLVRRKISTIEFQISPLSLIISVILISVYVYLVSDFNQALSIVPFQEKEGLPDPYYFTLVTHSLSVNSPNDAFYDSDAPINYQLISFLPPAFVAKLIQIPAQVSLWAIWMPIYKLLAFLLVAIGLMQSVPSRFRTLWWSLPLVCICLFCLAPLHPKYLLSFDWLNMVFLGTGYLLPGGNPPFTMAILLMGAVLFLFRTSDWHIQDGVLYAVLLALIIGTKTALFIPLGVYLGILSFFNLKSNWKPFLFTVVSVIPAAFIYYLSFHQSDGLIKLVFSPGYYLEYFNELTHTSGVYIGIFFMLGSLLIWAGIRLILLIGGSFIDRKFLIPELISVMGALGFSVIIPLMIRSQMVAPDGALLQDNSFDLIQFVRAAFFILTCSSIIAFFILLNSSRKYKRALTGLLSLYFLITLVSSIVRFTSVVSIPEDTSWRDELRTETRNSKINGLMAIRSTRKYSGQLVAAEGIGPWWFTSTRGDGTGYINSNKNFYRSQIVLNFLSKENPIDEVLQMRKEGVDYFVAHPDNKQILDSLKMKNLVFQDANNKWLYSFSK